MMQTKGPGDVFPKERSSFAALLSRSFLDTVTFGTFWTLSHFELPLLELSHLELSL